MSQEKQIKSSNAEECNYFALSLNLDDFTFAPNVVVSNHWSEVTPSQAEELEHIRSGQKPQLDEDIELAELYDLAERERASLVAIDFKSLFNNSWLYDSESSDNETLADEKRRMPKDTKVSIQSLQHLFGTKEVVSRIPAEEFNTNNDGKRKVYILCWLCLQCY